MTKEVRQCLMRGLLFCLFLVSSAVSRADWLELRAVVLAVADGNALRVRCNRGFVHQVRLSGSDAPELSQPGGAAARDCLRQLVLEKTVRIEHRYADEHGRILGRVYVGETFVNRHMLESGLAWYNDPDSDCPELKEVARYAIASRVGVWKRSNPVPPWQWRCGTRIRREGGAIEPPLPRFPRSPSSNEPKLVGHP